MNRIDQLLANFRRHIALSPRTNLPLSQRVWFVVYPPEEERRIVNRIPEFEYAAREERLGWLRIDFTGAFADWMDTYDAEERPSILADPELTESYADPGFKDFLCDRLQSAITSVPDNEATNTLFAISGLVDLYDYVHVSDVLACLDERRPSVGALPGTLVVFFPGEREGNTYRFLGARTGWNYLATPIVAEG